MVETYGYTLEEISQAFDGPNRLADHPNSNPSGLTADESAEDDKV